MIRTLALLTLALLAGCGESALPQPGPQGAGRPQTNTDNPKINVDTMFSYSGCTVYRFHDYSRVYFTKCTAGTADTSWTESCGKNCTRTVTNRTESQP